MKNITSLIQRFIPFQMEGVENTRAYKTDSFNPTLVYKCPKTGEIELIERIQNTSFQWGFAFLVKSELQAYKAAYTFGIFWESVTVEFSQELNSWGVIVKEK